MHAITLQDHPPVGRRVLVFRTSLTDPAGLGSLRPALDALVGPGGRWTFDLDDRDRVLRVETDRARIADVQRALHDRGLECVELQ